VRGLRVDRAAKHGALARGDGTALALAGGCLFTRCRLAALAAADGAEVALGDGNAAAPSPSDGLGGGGGAVVSTGGRFVEDNRDGEAGL
jgi:hypothetical protein